MSDKLKIQQHKLDQGSNVITVPPRRKPVRYKGLHGWLEYIPSRKIWRSVLKLVYPVTHNEEHKTEAEAELHIKKLIDTAASGNNKHVRSTD